jgi:hypothetical protein
MRDPDSFGLEHAYRETAEFREYKRGKVTEAALGRLEVLGKIDAQGVAWAAYDWLQMNEAGLPYLPILEDNARSEAQFWADTASPAELECYALAAMDRLAGSNAMFTSRQIKRLVAAIWRRMTPDERQAFKAWVAKDDGGTNERG